MDFFRNFTINLTAAGPASVLIAWIIGFVVLAIFGSGPTGSYAQGVMSVVGILLIRALGSNVR
ncbi:hypothetical protein [Caballeronia sp. LZ001]|uniref:hypothetical protein n=1 Tax=Caballeronia sp. LZ001 TaxID=3038553 RepID=UPI00286295DF|nr:hypothetical protein [Caballeronia sp. LZ001]MDR5800675.1 hypothetical protein [Caballeronia sp. LZ001]